MVAKRSNQDRGRGLIRTILNSVKQGMYVTLIAPHANGLAVIIASVLAAVITWHAHDHLSGRTGEPNTPPIQIKSGRTGKPNTPPIQIMKIYDCNEEDRTRWKPLHPAERKGKFFVAETEAHAGRDSFCLGVDLQSYGVNTVEERAGVAIYDVGLQEVIAVSAWVKIQEQDAEDIRRFEARLALNMRNSTEGGGWVTLSSRNKQLVPGTWNPLFLGTAQHDDKMILDGTVKDLFITVWCNDPYKGYIWIDDIAIYKGIEVRK